MGKRNICWRNIRFFRGSRKNTVRVLTAIFVGLVLSSTYIGAGGKDKSSLDHEIDSMISEQLTVENQITMFSLCLDQPRDATPPLSLNHSDHWWNSSWFYRKEITIDHLKVAGDLANFPVLISFDSDTDLAAHAQDDGDDIVFTDKDGGITFNHEIELFNDTSGNLVAWVNVTSLSSSSNTTLYMYYGNSTCDCQENPAFVWDTNFKMVQHLEEATGTHNDSTPNSNDGTPYFTPASNQNATGQISGADDFDGANDYVEVADHVSLDITGAVTVETWIHWNGYGGVSNQIIVSKKDSWYSSGGYILQTGGSSASGLYFSWGNGIDVDNYMHTSMCSANEWHHVVGTYDSGTAKIYIDGILEATEAGQNAMAENNDPLQIGRRGTGDYFSGIIDEVRVSNVGRSGEWISTCYQNQDDPSCFYNISNEEINPPPNTPSTPNGPSTIEVGQSGTYNTSATDPDGDLVKYRFDWDAAGSHDYSDWTDLVPSGQSANTSIA